MPRIKRWFPVSRDIFSDPQVTELLNDFGHAGFTMWMAFLKMAEDDEGAILARSYQVLAGSIAVLSRVEPLVAEKALRAWIKWRWVNQEWYGTRGLVFRAVNYSKYHPTQRMRPVQSFSTPPRAVRNSKFTEGEQRLNQAGYVQIFTGNKWRLLHHVIAEKALGKPLPVGAVVHHLNLNKQININQNLVICHDVSYHNTLHRRTAEHFEIDSSGQFIRKSRDSYFSRRGTPLASPPTIPSYPTYYKSPAETAGAVDNSKLDSKEEDIRRLVKLAVDIGGKDQVRAQKLCQWTISMVRTLNGEPHERVMMVTQSCLKNVRAKIADGYKIKDVWGLLEHIFNKERTKYMQGPENEAYKHQDIKSVGEILNQIAAKARSEGRAGSATLNGKAHHPHRP